MILTLNEDLNVHSSHCYFRDVVAEHVLSMLLSTKISRQQHRLAINFVSIKQQEFFAFYSVSVVVAVELLVRNQSLGCPETKQYDKIITLSK